MRSHPFASLALASLLALATACAESPPPPPAIATTHLTDAVLAPEDPQIELGAPEKATAFGQTVAFDGVAEALFWPALAKAAGKAPRDRVIVAAPRNTRVLDVLRVVWTLRETDVEVQTFGAGNELRSLLVSKKPATKADGPTCHAAVTVDPAGALDVRFPGGPAIVHGTKELTTAIALSAQSCRVRWLAVGAQTNAMAWGGVFDAAFALQASGAAPHARIVLAEAPASR